MLKVLRFYFNVKPIKYNYYKLTNKENVAIIILLSDSIVNAIKLKRLKTQQ